MKNPTPETRPDCSNIWVSPRKWLEIGLVLLCALNAGAAPLKPAGAGAGDLVDIQAQFKAAEDAVAAGNLPKAFESIGTVLRLAEAGGHSRVAGIAYGWRSQLAYQKGDLRQATSDLQSAVTALEAAGLIEQAIGALQQKAVLEERVGEMDAVEVTLTSARKLAADHSLQEVGTGLACDLVRLYMRIGKADAAKKSLMDAESGPSTNARLKNRILMSRARFNGAFGDVDEALSAYQEAIPGLVSAGDIHEAANAQFNAASILGEKKRYDEASSLLEEAVVNFTRSGSLSAAGMAWSLHAGHLIAQDRLDAAEPILRQADKALRETNYVERIAENEERYAHYWKKRKDPTKAREAAEKAALTFDQLGAVDRAKALRAYFAGD